VAPQRGVSASFILIPKAGRLTSFRLFAPSDTEGFRLWQTVREKTPTKQRNLIRLWARLLTGNCFPRRSRPPKNAVFLGVPLET